MQFLIVTTDFNAVFLLDILVKREKEEEEEHLEDIVVVVISVSPPLERGALFRSAARPYRGRVRPDQDRARDAERHREARAFVRSQSRCQSTGSREQTRLETGSYIRFARRRSRGRGRCHQPETPREYKTKHQNEHSRPKKGSNVCVCVWGGGVFGSLRGGAFLLLLIGEFLMR